MLALYPNVAPEIMLLQTNWIREINPVLINVSNNARIIQNVALIIGDNTINHKLGKKLTGWRLIRVRAAATIYDKQDSNSYPALTLVLNSGAVVTVDLEVF